jgi:hypothetical protein
MHKKIHLSTQCPLIGHIQSGKIELFAHKISWMFSEFGLMLVTRRLVVVNDPPLPSSDLHAGWVSPIGWLT